MQAYRITKTKHKDGLSPAGAMIAGGRFNTAGKPMVYLATSEAVAILEVRVHSPDRMPPTRLFHTIEVPDGSVATLKDLGLKLPLDWRAVPAPAATQLLGDAWVVSNASLGLYVPSVVSPGDLNILINVNHPDFGKVRAIDARVEHLDPRLWQIP